MDNVELAITKLMVSTDPARVADGCAIKCLRTIATKQVDTAATDGLVILYNPDFVAGLTVEQTVGLLVHELCHVRFSHTQRFSDSRWLDHKRANQAMDREINPIVRDAGYKLPEGGCWPADIFQPEGLAWEEYYQIEANQEEQQDENQDGKQDGEQVADGLHKPGELAKRFAPEMTGESEEEIKQQAKEVAEQIQDASQASRIKERPAGNKPANNRGDEAGSERLQGAELIEATDCRWQDVVIDLIASRASGESIADWSRPSRRSIASGTYRPARRKVSGLRLALVLDVSGSCVGYFSRWQSMAREMVEAIGAITEMEILYHDIRVQGRSEWSRRDGEEVTLESDGGGGTCHVKVLQEVETLDVDAAILFTDSDSRWPDSFAVDCVTVQPPCSTHQTPFGKTVRIDRW